MKLNKKIIALLVLLPSLLFHQSCTDLSEEIYDIIPQSEFGKTPEELASIIGPAYSSLQGIVWEYSNISLDAATDCAVIPTRGTDWYDGGVYQELQKHTWTPENGTINEAWNFCNSGITTINQILYQLDQAEEVANKEQTVAQLRGIRALYYSFLIDLFGDVPIVTDFTNVELPQQSSRADVFDFIVSELRSIEDLVPAENNNENYGKINRGVIQMILAKMYLNAIVWKGVPMWQDAITYCDKIMVSGQYILEPDWKSNFAVHNEVSKENIFVVPFDENAGYFQIMNLTLHYKSHLTFELQTGGWNGICGLTEYIEAYADNDPRKAGSFLWGPQLDAKTGELLTTGSGDPLIFTIEVSSLTNADQAEGARCFKYEFEKGGKPEMNNDFVVFRLADVYLMKAEAVLRNGGDPSVALALVNTIRERAFKNGDNNLASVDLDGVLSERAFELAWEGPRRQDLIRYEIASGTKYWTKAWRFKPEGTSIVQLYPIPQSAINANPNLHQNPGY